MSCYGLAKDDPQMSRLANAILVDEPETIFVSAISGYEIGNKFQLGKLPQAAVMMQDFEGWVRRLGFTLLPVTTAHAVRAGLFEGEHRDPFDRLLAAQAEGEGLVLLSSDEKLDGFWGEAGLVNAVMVRRIGYR